MQRVVHLFTEEIYLLHLGVLILKEKDQLGAILFEDNAEFGLGMRLSADKQLQMAHFTPKN
jgi:hypothetical protein